VNGVLFLQLRSELENDKKKACDELACLSEANKKAETELAAAREENRRLVEAVTPVVDSLVPLTSEDAGRPLLDRLHQMTGALHGYIRDATHACAVTILGVVKAVMPHQDMEPFATGHVAGVSDEDLTRYEEEVQPVADAMIERLDF